MRDSEPSSCSWKMSQNQDGDVFSSEWCLKALSPEITLIVSTRPDPAGYMVETPVHSSQNPEFFARTVFQDFKLMPSLGNPWEISVSHTLLIHGEDRQVAALKPILVSHLVFFLSLRGL